jgi:low temperature requirement protein LtrA
MAGLLLAALAIPDAFGDEALLFAIAYGIVRGMQLVLFVVASRDDPGLRHAVGGLVLSTMIGIVLLFAAAFADGTLQGALWALALLLDVGGPLVIDPSGWRMQPEHFAERHGLIVIIALGESIVAIGVGAEAGVTAGVAVAAVLGIAVAAAQWWLYFDIVALVAARRLQNAEEGRERNTIGRDSFSYLHFPMVAGIVLVALGMKKTLGHVEDPLELVPAFALLGGLATYLLAHVSFRYRHIRTINRRRTLLALILLGLLPAAVEIPALAVVTIVTALVWILIAYETRSYGESRARVRQEDFAPEAAS